MVEERTRIDRELMRTKGYPRRPWPEILKWIITLAEHPDHEKLSTYLRSFGHDNLAYVAAVMNGGQERLRGGDLAATLDQLKSLHRTQSKQELLSLMVEEPRFIEALQAGMEIFDMD